MFVERGIRGGISQCSKRHIKANNKYLENFDTTKESMYIMYLDANNLYGYDKKTKANIIFSHIHTFFWFRFVHHHHRCSMMQHLPIGGYKWCDDCDKFSPENIQAIADDSSVGYILEVDLQYPQTLHDLHKDYPFCPENINVPGSKIAKKLLLTLYDKKNYVIHYKMLKLVLQQGLILKKVHQTGVLEFRQSPWLKPYIELNTSLRAQATNTFDKDQSKLMNNATFGKTMENKRKQVDITLKNKYGMVDMVLVDWSRNQISSVLRFLMRILLQ